MNLEERQRFVQALRTAAKNPVYRAEYRRLARIHSRMPSKLLHHMPQIFLPWHRWYLLHQIDCRITVPYWDWNKDMKHWARKTEVRDVYNAVPHGLGGDGILPYGCVTEGSLREGVFFIPKTIGEDCLKINFNLSCSLPSREKIQEKVNVENITVFEKLYSRQDSSCFTCVLRPHVETRLCSVYARVLDPSQFCR